MTATSELLSDLPFDSSKIFSILVFRLKASAQPKTAELIVCAEMVNMLLLCLLSDCCNVKIVKKVLLNIRMPTWPP